MDSYYKSQLSNLKPSEYEYTIKITDGNGNTTKSLALNPESIRDLQEFLVRVTNELLLSRLSNVE